MSLPTAQQRVLDRMEGALQASEPHMAAMFAIFARINASEPVGAEPLSRPRRRKWLQHGTALYAFVLVPAMFAMIVIGAVLSSRAHSASACEVGYSASSGSPWLTRSCQLPGNQKTTLSRAGLASCAARIPAVRFVTRARSDQAAIPPAVAAAAAGLPATC